MSPAELILLNPPHGMSSGDSLSVIIADSAPLAAASMNAAAVDAEAGEALAAALRASLKGGGRMLGPAGLPVPAFLQELARDDEVWVAELESGAVTSAPVIPTLRRRTESR